MEHEENYNHINAIPNIYNDKANDNLRKNFLNSFRK